MHIYTLIKYTMNGDIFIYCDARDAEDTPHGYCRHHSALCLTRLHSSSPCAASVSVCVGGSALMFTPCRRKSERKLVASCTAAASSPPRPCGRGRSCQKRSPARRVANCTEVMTANVSPRSPPYPRVTAEGAGRSQRPPIHRSTLSAVPYSMRSCGAQPDDSHSPSSCVFCRNPIAARTEL